MRLCEGRRLTAFEDEETIQNLVRLLTETTDDLVPTPPEPLKEPIEVVLKRYADYPYLVKGIYMGHIVTRTKKEQKRHA